MERTQLLTIAGMASFVIAFLVWMALRVWEHRVLGRAREHFGSLLSRYSQTCGSRRDAAAFLIEIGVIREPPKSPYELSVPVKFDLINGDFAGAAIAYASGILLAPIQEEIGRIAKRWYRQKRDQLFPEPPKSEQQSVLEAEIRKAISQCCSLSKTCNRRDRLFYLSTLLGLAATGLFVFGPSLRDLVVPPPPKTKPSAGSPNQLATVMDFQKAAVRRYPELGIAGSPLNAKFVARYTFYKQVKPDFFKNSDWPVKLAEEIAGNQPAK